jgi:hypothetical protein
MGTATGGVAVVGAAASWGGLLQPPITITTINGVIAQGLLQTLCWCAGEYKATAQPH